MNSNAIRQRKARAFRVALSRRQMISHPQSLPISVQLDRTFRFQAVAASANDTVTPQDLGDFICVATATTAAYQLAKAIKIRKVEMWGPPASNLNPVTVACEFASPNAGTYGNSAKKTDTSVGSTEPAHLVHRPPKGSQASQWIDSTVGNVLFRLTYPANAIIDITYSAVLRDESGVQAVAGAVAGATVGQLYYRALNSASSSTTNLPPVSLITI